VSVLEDKVTGTTPFLVSVYKAHAWTLDEINIEFNELYVGWWTNITVLRDQHWYSLIYITLDCTTLRFTPQESIINSGRKSTTYYIHNNYPVLVQAVKSDLYVHSITRTNGALCIVTINNSAILYNTT